MGLYFKVQSRRRPFALSLLLMNEVPLLPPMHMVQYSHSLPEAEATNVEGIQKSCLTR